MTLKFTIPIPPSENSMFGVTRKGIRYIAPKYAAWKQEAGWTIRNHQASWDAAQWAAVKALRAGQRYEVRISVPAKMAGDVDNRDKGALDLLKDLQITADDKHCQRCTVERDASVPKGWAVVRLFPSPMREGA